MPLRRALTDWTIVVPVTIIEVALIRTQTSLNLAYGSAIASIGLTIPAVTVASLVLHRPLYLGLGPTEIVLLAITVVAGILTLVHGLSTLLQAAVHLSIFAAYIFLAINP